MRVALVVHAYPPDSLGGTELYTQRLADGLHARGHSVRVYAYAAHELERQPPRWPAGAEGAASDAGAPVTRLSFSLDDTDNPLRDEYDNPRVAQMLRELWTAERPDIVHVTHCGYLSTAPLRMAHELGVPSVVTLTDLWALCPVGTLLRHDGSLCSGPQQIGACARCVAHMGPRGHAYARLSERVPLWAWGAAARLGDRPVLRRVPYLRWLSALRMRPAAIRERLLSARALFSPSRFQITMFERNGYPPGSVGWAPHGIPACGDMVCHVHTRGTDRIPMRLGCIGALAPHKGAHLPLEAYARLGVRPDRATLTYWGSVAPPERDGGYGHALLERIRRTPGVNHRGPFPHDALADVLGELDVLIVPSLCYENTPTIIYEALAHGVPVVGSDQGGVKELVELYAGGWLFPRGDAAALAERMRTLVAEPGLLSQATGRIRPVPAMADHIAAVVAIYEQETHGR